MVLIETVKAMSQNYKEKKKQWFLEYIRIVVFIDNSSLNPRVKVWHLVLQP